MGLSLARETGVPVPETGVPPPYFLFCLPASCDPWMAAIQLWHCRQQCPRAVFLNVYCAHRASGDLQTDADAVGLSRAWESAFLTSIYVMPILWPEKTDFLINIFIWLCRVLVAACGLFSCGMWTLSWGMWDLVPWPGIKPWPPKLGVRTT